MTRPTVVSVYVPLCSERCAFCDCLTIPSTLRDVVRYREALLAEIDAVAPGLEGQRVEAVRFAGGVPLLMGGAGVAEVLFRLRRRLQVADDAEVTVETVPGKVDEHNLRLFAQIGVNRLEFGLATLVQAEHVRLRCPGVYGQIHEHDALRRHLGPSDWGVELMYGLPGQTLSTWEETVGKALALDPPHVSVDRMRRPARAKDGQEEDGEALAALRGHAVARLREAGYAEYVVDRFAKPGCASRHVELTYAGADEVGLGAGARSLVGGYSYRNVDDVPTYLACSADPERVVKDVAVVDDVARDLLAAARGSVLRGGLRAWKEHGRAARRPCEGGGRRRRGVPPCLRPRGVPRFPCAPRLGTQGRGRGVPAHGRGCLSQGRGLSGPRRVPGRDLSAIRRLASRCPAPLAPPSAVRASVFLHLFELFVAAVGADGQLLVVAFHVDDVAAVQAPVCAGSGLVTCMVGHGYSFRRERVFGESCFAPSTLTGSAAAQAAVR